MKTISIDLLNKIHSPELSTSMLLSILSSYSGPRKEIHNLVKKGLIIPIKQGIYIASSHQLKLRPYSKDILANMIYGPSYISLETALSHYGVIPERVESVTSVCLGNSRSFKTEVATFEYCHLKETLYPFGIMLNEIFQNTFCLYASLEKALIDFIYFRETVKNFQSADDYFEYVVDSYRFDMNSISEQISFDKIKLTLPIYTQNSTSFYKKINWFFGELIRRYSSH